MAVTEDDITYYEYSEIAGLFDDLSEETVQHWALGDGRYGLDLRPYRNEIVKPHLDEIVRPIIRLYRSGPHEWVRVGMNSLNRSVRSVITELFETIEPGEAKTLRFYRTEEGELQVLCEETTN